MTRLQQRIKRRQGVHSQRAIAKQCGIAEDFFIDIMYNRPRSPRLVTLQKLAQWLGITLAECTRLYTAHAKSIGESPHGTS